MANGVGTDTAARASSKLLRKVRRNEPLNMNEISLANKFVNSVAVAPSIEFSQLLRHAERSLVVEASRRSLQHEAEIGGKIGASFFEGKIGHGYLGDKAGASSMGGKISQSYLEGAAATNSMGGKIGQSVFGGGAGVGSMGGKIMQSHLGVRRVPVPWEVKQAQARLGAAQALVSWTKRVIAISRAK